MARPDCAIKEPGKGVLEGPWPERVYRGRLTKRGAAGGAPGWTGSPKGSGRWALKG